MNIHVKSIVSAFAFSLLFYSKSLGLNLLLISIVIVTLVKTINNIRPTPWRYAIGYIASAVFVFINPSVLSIFVHFMVLLLFIGKSISHKTSVYISWLIGCITLFISSAANYIQLKENRTESENPKEKDISPQLINRIKGGLVAILLLFTFGLLYRNANPVFENLIEQINLDFISIPWLFFTFLGYVLFLHILRPFDSKELIAFDLSQSNFLEKPTELVLIGEKQKLESESTLGSIIFFSLNLLLVFFLVTDVIYLLQNTKITNSEYSQSVHQGVYALMFSIVCAIALILYFFRGNLNFYKKNQRIKSLTYLWIVLNITLVVFTWYKNHLYIEALGLTYKRIGVFIYLLLTLTGLITAYLKIVKIRSFTFLLRTNIATIFTMLFISAAIPWDKTITWFNLSAIEKPDIFYLTDLGANNSEQLFNYANDYPHRINSELKEIVQKKHADFLEDQAEKTWQEYTIYQIVNTNK
ncbi:DUF4173 domain-containing protein [Aurantibacter sp.]|uniref:DUF4153 domain-containing protein n=1 Tax=Aurantibacter sp. TaxID=2807103 RepID=UPI0032666A17